MAKYVFEADGMNAENLRESANILKLTSKLRVHRNPCAVRSGPEIL